MLTGPMKGGAHNALVLERQFQQDRDPLIGTILVLAGDIEKDVFPAIAPVFRQMVCDTLRTFCEEE